MERNIKVGIFWFYQSNLIARSIVASSLVSDSLGYIDSPFQHVTEWEQRQLYLPFFPELIGSEYQEYPRGRVVYSVQKKQVIVYLDKSLFKAKVKADIAAYFEFTECQVLWKVDPHYHVYTSLGF